MTEEITLPTLRVTTFTTPNKIGVKRNVSVDDIEDEQKTLLDRLINGEISGYFIAREGE